MNKLAHQQNTLCRHSVTAANSRTELLFVDKIVVVVVGVVVVAAAAAAAAAAAVVCCMCLGYDAYIVRTRIHKQWDLALPGILPSEPRDTEPDWSLRLQYVHSTQNSKREKKRYIFQQYSFSYVPTRIPLFCTYRTVVPVKYLVLVVFRSTVTGQFDHTYDKRGGSEAAKRVRPRSGQSLHFANHQHNKLWLSCCWDYCADLRKVVRAELVPQRPTRTTTKTPPGVLSLLTWLTR